ncbi:hypothetical protein HJC23_000787 [Cyclotella cryptica]|uniref:Sugar phosphate transporter domain-containing protein n=1 Tax=Cyclotella cryptica TaxID=29204 RepID=A0ABD3Q4R8_9STRA
MSLADSPSFSSMASLASAPSSASAAFSTTAGLVAAAASPSINAASSPSLLSASWLSDFASNKHLVGSAWILSSAILTTYSTTKFLKYRTDQDDQEWSKSNQGGIINRLRLLTNRNARESEGRKVSQSAQTATTTPQPRLSRASLLTLYRFSGSLFLGLFLHSKFYNLSKVYPRFLQTLQASKLFLLPSLFLFIANYTNSIALDRIGISLTYTSKCGIPLITVLFTVLLDGVNALPSKATLCSLIPIALGIGAASWNSPTFELLGFVAAMASTTSQAALNVVSKRVMRSTGIRGAEAQRAMVLVALGIGLVMAGANGVGEILRDWKSETGIRGDSKGILEKGKAAGISQQQEQLQTTMFAPAPSHPPLWLTFLAVLAYHMEYVLSFMFVGLVEPITYGTCDALRRLLIIVSGRQLFGGDRFSKVNFGGIGMALLGALMYSITSAKGYGGLAKNV